MDGMVIGPRYKCNGSWLEANIFMNVIFDELQKVPYAEHQFLAAKLSANPNHLKNILKDGIVKYCKENPGMSISEVCRNLKVRSEYIEELCDEGRLEILTSELSNLKSEFSDLENNASKEAEEMVRRSIIMGLSETINNSNNNNVPTTSNGYHSDIFGDNSRRGFRSR